MILGIGTDLMNLERMRRVVEDPAVDSPFLVRTFTERERDEARRRPDPVLYFATRFAGKEAVFKSLGLEGGRVRLDEIEIRNAENGQPFVILSGELRRKAELAGITDIRISLSSDTDYALAFAVAQASESQEETR